jgi:hypothetical protein
MNEDKNKGTKEQIELCGGNSGGQYAWTSPRNNEVGVWYERHTWCGGMTVEVYQRREKTNFFDFAFIDETVEKCLECKPMREKWEAKETERKYKESIEVICEIGEWGWSWSVAELGKSSDGRIWFRYGSGCSCDDISDEEWQELREVENAKMACRHIGSAADRARYIATAQTMIGERV